MAKNVKLNNAFKNWIIGTRRNTPSLADAFEAGAAWACKAQREADVEWLLEWEATRIPGGTLVVPSTED